MLRIAVLGRLSLQLNGRAVSPPVGRPARLLLGWLALHPGAHSRAAVAAELWPDVLDESARGSLRVALVDVRRALGDAADRVLVATREQIGLPDRPELDVDARRFTELLDADMTSEALALWRGELLDGLDGGDWLLELRGEYRDRRSRALAALADQAAARGDLHEAVRLARERTAFEPLSEEATRELMRRLTDVGDRAEALVAYERLAERLRSELRTAPSAPTRALAHALREGDHDDQAGVRLAVESWLAVMADTTVRRSAFVGRDAELALLIGHARERRRLVVIVGDAGAGKTRLLFELARVASSEGISVLSGRCQQEPLAPYEPFVHALREHVARVGAAAVARLAGEELSRLLPELRVAQPAQPAGEVAEAARLRLFEGVRATLEQAARHQPVLLVLDDLHWADRSTVLLLAHLVRTRIKAPITIVGAYRPTDLGRDHALRGTLAELAREQETATVQLAGLGPAATASIVRGLIDVEPDASLVEHVLHQTLGNPFFVEQLANDWRESGALINRDGRAVLDAPAAAAAPSGVRDLVRGRLQRLGDLPGPALELASALGSEFSLALLRRVAEVEEGRLLDGLEAAEAAGLIVAIPDRPGRFMFKHALVRAAMYQQLTDLRRARLHSRIADALEQLGGDPAELAHHAFAARAVDGPERAVRTSRLAAEEAVSGIAYEEAADHYERALEALQQATGAGGGERCELLLALGEAQARAADPAAEPTFLAAERQARDLGDAELLARAVLGRCGIGVTIVGLDTARARSLEDALEQLGDSSPALRSRVLARLAIELYYAPGRTRAVPLSATATELARGGQDPDALLLALSARHVALWTPDGLEERLAVADEMIRFAQEHGRPEHELQGRNWLCADLWETGRLDRFETEARRHAQLAARLRLPTYMWYEPLWQASLAALRADWDEAEGLITRAEQAGTDAGDRNAPLFAWGLRLAMRLARHEFADEDLQQANRHIEESPASPAWRCLRCWFAAQARNLETANADLDWLADGGFAALPYDANWLPAMFELTEAVCLLGDRTRATEMYQLLSPYGDRHITAMRGTVTWGSGQSLLGRLARTAGNLEQAAQRFESALELERRWGARAWLVKTHADYADVLVARSGPGDRDRAVELAREAITQADALHINPTIVPGSIKALAERSLLRS